MFQRKSLTVAMLHGRCRIIIEGGDVCFTVQRTKDTVDRETRLEIYLNFVFPKLICQLDVVWWSNRKKENTHTHTVDSQRLCPTVYRERTTKFSETAKPFSLCLPWIPVQVRVFLHAKRFISPSLAFPVELKKPKTDVRAYSRIYFTATNSPQLCHLQSGRRGHRGDWMV